MNPREHLISNLAKFLRINGDKVISGTFKLSLTTSALCLLNNIFVEVLIHDRFENTDPVPSHCIAKAYEDAQFLYDFIKKTPALKLFHGAQTLRGGVNLSHFTSLRVLELRKIPTHLIVGLTTLSSQLKALICHRSIYSLRELFGNSMDEPDLAGIWTELVELNVSYNYLEELDDSLKILPNVEILDSSHNNLKHLDDIQILNNLIVVNLSYNELDHLPVFSNLSCYTLKVLFIRNNNLDDLQGLENFINLEEFDASCNSLSEYAVLKPLEKLKFLKVLYLEGNPLFFYKRHREKTARYLHSDVIIRGILLNGKNLSSNEISKSSVHIRNVSYSEPIGEHQTSINFMVEEISNIITRPELNYLDETNTSPILEQTVSDQNHSLSGKDDESCSSYSENAEEDTKLLNKNTTKVKHQKMREAVIFEAEQSEKKEQKFEKSVDNVPSHLQTKQLLETRRKEYGSEWLIPTHSFQTLVTDSTIPKVPFNTPVSHIHTLYQLELPIESSLKKLISNEECHSNITSDPSEDMQSTSSHLATEPFKQCLKSMEANTNEHFDNIEISTVPQELFASESEKSAKSKIVRRNSQLSDDIEILSPHVTDSRDVLTNKTYPDQGVNQNPSGSEVFQWAEYSDEYTSDGEDLKSDENESDEECEARIFVAERKEKDKGKFLFISIGDKFMKEKDCLTGKIIDTLDLRSLFSIKQEKLESENEVKYAIHFVFDTPKTSRQKRVYVFDELESTKNMMTLLQPFVDAKTLEDMTLGALQCLKCGAQFSKQGAHRKLLKTNKPYLNQSSHPSSCDSSKGYLQEADMCPGCGSIMIVEIDTFPVPSVQLPKNNDIHKTQAALEISQKLETSTGALSLSSSPGGYFSNLFSSILNSPKLKRKETFENLHEPGTPATNDISFDSKGNRETLSRVFNQGTSYEKLENNKTSLEDSDSLLRQGFKRSSSDITILSNPSQSSIAVISSGSEGGLILDAISEKDSIYSPVLPLSPTSQPDTEHQVDLLTTGPSSTIYSESASTGSASSSVCTAVEKNVSDKLLSQNISLSDAGKEIKKELSTVEGNLTFKSNVCNEASGIASDNSDTYHSVGENVSYKECSSDTNKNISVVTSMQPSCANQSSKLNTLLAQRESISYENFSSIDHRLKLHLEVEVFGTDEVLDACLEAGIIPLSSAEEFNGMLVISSKKIYIMKLLGNICEEMHKYIQMVHCWPLTQLKSVKVMLGSQGFITVCGTENKAHSFILRDADICNCFIAYLTDLIRQQLQGSYFPKFEASTEESLNQLYKEIIDVYYPESTAKNKEKEILLYLLAFWSSSSLGEENQPVAIVLTLEDVLVSRMTYKKLPAKTKVLDNYTHFQYIPIVKEKISNLTKVHLQDTMLSIELHFLDEDTNKEHCWTVITQTHSSLFSLISALKTPWEKLFGIELPL